MFAMIIIKLVIASLLTLNSLTVPNGYLSVQLNDQYRNSVSNVKVTAIKDNLFVVLNTDSNGIANFDLSVGTWVITVCSQTFDYTIVQGDTSALIMLDCNIKFNYLPLISN